MWTLGIDVAKRRHNATLLDEEGKAVLRNVSFAHSRQGLDGLLARLAATGQSTEGILVGMEATGHYWMVLFQCLTKAGYTVRVINPIVTAARRNVTIRGTKTDAVDSFLIARVLREEDPKVSAVPEEDAQRLRDLTRLRFECAQSALAEKQRLTALLDLVFPEYADHFSNVFGATSREVLAEFPSRDRCTRATGSIDSLFTRGGKGGSTAVFDVTSDPPRMQLAFDWSRLPPGLEPEPGVEVGERLVKKIDQRLLDHGPGQRGPLLLSARDLGRAPLQHRLKLESLGDFLNPRLDLRSRPPAELQGIADVLAETHVRVERVVLKDHGNAPAGRGPAGDIALGDHDPALVREIEPGHQPQARGLAAAGGAEQGEELAVTNLQ